MFKLQKKTRRLTELDRIQETYRDHPCMHSVNLLKEKLKQEKIQDKVFCQSIKQKQSND